MFFGASLTYFRSKIESSQVLNDLGGVVLNVGRFDTVTNRSLVS